MGRQDDKQSTDLSRRRLLGGSGLALGALATASVAAARPRKPAPAAPATPPVAAPATPAATPAVAPGEEAIPPEVAAEANAPSVTPLNAPDWQRVRAQWALDWNQVDLSAMLFASNPAIVRDAIDRHRKAFDRQPVLYLEGRNRPLQDRARRMAGAYFGVDYKNVALCDSTTGGIGLLYAGIGMRPGTEVLTTTQDYYVTHEALRLQAARSGGSFRKISLFDRADAATIPGIVGRIVSEIRPHTRVLALTWVHSSTGFKMPIKEIAAALRPINALRPERDRVLFCVDGVHGFGVENTTLPELGCDFLVAGCHKWLFGPRGTGVILGSDYGWSRVTPTVPSFLASNAYGAWMGGYDPGPTTGARMTPGGFKAFEYVWAMSEAFQFQQWVGKPNVEARTRELATRLKTGLRQMPHVQLITPMSPQMSAGIVSFDVAGLSATQAVDRLRGRNVIGSAAPYSVPHVRLTPSIRNTPEDIDYALAAVRTLA